ncbi:HEAT repeat domain-containing protein [bacterium]|nr:HEAT repeat domain-containing protein [bacterium]
MPQRQEKNSWLSRTILNKLMNITSDEWPRIAISWSLQFLYRAGFIIGWTVLLSIFATRFGIMALPYFFILYALLDILGAIGYSFILERFSKDMMIIITALGGALLFLLVGLLSFYSETLFIFIAIAGLSVVFTQLYILNSGFIEDLFSPLESERTFPLIESAETIGGIVGGLLITGYVGVLSAGYLLNFLVVILIMFVPIMIFHRQLLKKLPFIHFKKRHKKTGINFAKIKENLGHIKRIPFLKLLLVVVICQWVFSNLLEFQFIEALFGHLPEGAHMEKELTYGLGSLQILFHSVALLMQLLVASRIISSLGIVSSLLLHPLVTLLSLGTMLIRFGMPSAILTKLNYEMTFTIYKNAYHSSYYAIESKIREQVRELLEGFAHPLGTLVGMGTLLLLEQFFHGTTFNQSVTVLMIAIMGIMLFVIVKNDRKYTQISIKNLLYSKDTAVQLNAVEILGQKGHKNATEILTRMLNETEIADKVKIRILNTLGHMKDPESLSEIIDALEHKNPEIRKASLIALEKFNTFTKKETKHPFSTHRTNNILKKMFLEENDYAIKSLVMGVLAKHSSNKIVPYLLSLLKSAKGYQKADAIRVCGNFHDISLVHYLMPFLESDDPIIKSRTIVALWQFKKHRMKLLQEIKNMLFSKNKADRLAAYYILGEINALQEKNRLLDLLKSEDEDEKLAVAIALVKMNIREGVPIIIERIVYDESSRKNLLYLLQLTLGKRMKNYMLRVLNQTVSLYINHILSESNKKVLEELDTNTLMKLRSAYELVNEHEEVENVDKVLRASTKQYNQELQLNPI